MVLCAKNFTKSFLHYGSQTIWHCASNSYSFVDVVINSIKRLYLCKIVGIFNSDTNLFCYLHKWLFKLFYGLSEPFVKVMPRFVVFSISVSNNVNAIKMLLQCKSGFFIQFKLFKQVQRSLEMEMTATITQKSVNKKRLFCSFSDRCM